MVVAAVAAILIAGVGAATIVGGDDDTPSVPTIPTDGTPTPELEEAVDDMFPDRLPGQTGDLVEPPDFGRPDLYQEPLSCTAFSPALFDQFGPPVAVDEPHPSSRGNGVLESSCNWSADSAAPRVITEFYAPGDNGAGAGALWAEHEFDLTALEGYADLGDGAGLQVGLGNCNLVMALGNVALILLGDGMADEEACRQQVLPFAEDFAAHNTTQ